MKTLLSAAIVLTTLVVSGCNSTGTGGSGARSGVTASSANTGSNGGSGTSALTAQPSRASAPAPVARGNSPARPSTNPDVSVLRLTQAETPAEVRAIEKIIDRRSALLADTVRIEVSKNYEWDVSLTGDGVSPPKADQGGTIAEATGTPRAYFRNMDIRARDRIIVWRSGLGVTPFIKIQASGAVSYIDTDDAGKPRVKRATTCRINNASIKFEDEILGIPSAEQLGVQTTGLQEKGQ